MKKVLVLLLLCLSSTVMVFGQETPALHWTPVEVKAEPMAMSAILVIDDVEQGEASLNFEIGIFDQNGVCRGAKLPRLKKGRYKYSPVIFGDSGYTYTCRIYDHANKQELDLIFVPNTDDPLLYEGNHFFGASNNPYVLNFKSGKKDKEK